VDDQREVEIRSIIREFVSSLAPEPIERSVEGSDLADDLGYHSLGLVELAFALEDEFDLPPITENSAGSIRTVPDIENYVITQLRELEVLEGTAAR